MSTTYGPGLTPLRWCCLCLSHYVREATHYTCPECDDPGLKPPRSMVLPPAGTPCSLWGGGGV